MSSFLSNVFSLFILCRNLFTSHQKSFANILSHSDSFTWMFVNCDVYFTSHAVYSELLKYSIYFIFGFNLLIFLFLFVSFISFPCIPTRNRSSPSHHVSSFPHLYFCHISQQLDTLPHLNNLILSMRLVVGKHN